MSIQLLLLHHVISSWEKEEHESAASVLMDYLVNENKLQAEKNATDVIDVFLEVLPKLWSDFHRWSHCKQQAFAIISELEIKDMTGSSSLCSLSPNTGISLVPSTELATDSNDQLHHYASQMPDFPQCSMPQRIPVFYQHLDYNHD